MDNMFKINTKYSVGLPLVFASPLGGFACRQVMVLLFQTVAFPGKYAWCAQMLEYIHNENAARRAAEHSLWINWSQTMAAIFSQTGRPMRVAAR